VTLQNGRVTLVEPPFSVRRIASRLRVLLASDRGEATQDDLLIREDQRPGHWLGLVYSASAPAPWAPAVDQGRGLTAVVPTCTADLRPIIDRVATGGEPEVLGAALAELIGEAGLIHLSARGDEWLFFWPRPERPLWLCSTLRLPPLWDLAATAQESPGHCFRVAAAGSDVVVTLPAGLSDWALGAASPGVPALVATEMADTVADGGPALLEAIAAQLHGRPGPAGAMVIEAR
jgi:hypothetical protein